MPHFYSFTKIEALFYNIVFKSRVFKKFMPSFAKATRPLGRFIVGLWISKIYNPENIPEKGGYLLISNHSSYFDFFIISALLWRKHLYFLATRKLSRHIILKYFMYYSKVIYIDRDFPGVEYFKRIIKLLKEGNVIVLFPEGTRTLTGRIQKPKLGFVKLAITAQVPIVPIGIRGTYEILPRHKKFLRFKRCTVFVGKPVVLCEYYRQRSNKEALEKIANDIMDKIGSLIKYENSTTLNYLR